MYGMVNKAIEGLITEQFGEDIWEQIVVLSGIEEDSFISLDPYPDSVTYDLVGAASKILDLPAEGLLQAFGTYWTKYVGREGYTEIMELEDKPLGEFLVQLNEMHTRVAMTFPELDPPSFEIDILKDGEFDVHYRSNREGLAAMTLGLLEGILELMELKGTVAWKTRKGDDADHDVFRVQVH
jgi:hypothetical protein